jgi:serine/threonine protein kinase
LLPASRRVFAAPGAKEKRKGPPHLIGNARFLLEKKVGQGCFGGIHRGRDLETRGVVAVKVEEARSSAPQFEHEMRILQLLAKPARPQGVTEIFQYGTVGDHNYLVMELLGKSLEDRVQMMGGKLDIKTSTLIGQQIMRPIEYFHSKGLMHRDIKPENFMFGNDTKILHLYIIDFGLSKKYWDKGHIQPKTGRSFTGTARYASINCHAGYEQSRRDDLEAIGHMLLYFLRGHMPWSGLDAPTREDKNRLIMETKQKTPLPELCKGFPPAFENYLRYCRGLEFKQRPDYAVLRRGFREAREAYEAEHGKVLDNGYQWYVGRKLADNVIPSDQFGEEVLRQPDDCS